MIQKRDMHAVCALASTSLALLAWRFLANAMWGIGKGIGKATGSSPTIPGKCNVGDWSGDWGLVRELGDATSYANICFLSKILVRL